VLDSIVMIAQPAAENWSVLLTLPKRLSVLGSEGLRKPDRSPRHPWLDRLPDVSNLAQNNCPLRVIVIAWNALFISCAIVFVDGSPESPRPSPRYLLPLRHQFAVTRRKGCVLFAV